MYTPAQVSEMLNIPPSTLRRLSSEFADMLSKQRSRKRKYSESDIALLKRIREMTGEGVSLAEIRQALTIRIPESEPEPEPTADSTLALIPGIAGELARIDESHHRLTRELERLLTERQDDRQRLERLEAWLSLPWWVRLFRSPPQR